MKLLPVLAACVLAIGCEPPPMIDPCAAAHQKMGQADFDGAIVEFQKALTSDPAHRSMNELSLATCVARKASQQVIKGQYDAATETLRVAQGLGPEVLKISRQQFVALSISTDNDPAKVADLFAYLVKVARDEATPRAAGLAATCSKVAWQAVPQGQYDKAEQAFRLAGQILEDNTLEKDDALVLADLMRGRKLQAANNLRDARDAFARTLAKRKSEATAALAARWLQEVIDISITDALSKQDWGGAVAQIDEALKALPEFKSWWYGRKLRTLLAQSDAHAGAGRLEAALMPLKEALNLPDVEPIPVVNPKIHSLAFRLASAAMRAGDYRGAISHFELVGAIDDKDPLLYELRATCYEKENLWRQAAGDYEVLASLIPERKAEFIEKAKVTRAKFKPADGDGPRDK